MNMENFWNSLKPSKRLALLNSAGYINYGRAYANRVWSFVPASVRVDIKYACQRLGVAV